MHERRSYSTNRPVLGIGEKKTARARIVLFDRHAYEAKSHTTPDVCSIAQEQRTNATLEKRVYYTRVLHTRGSSCPFAHNAHLFDMELDNLTIDHRQDRIDAEVPSFWPAANDCGSSSRSC